MRATFIDVSSYQKVGLGGLDYAKVAADGHVAGIVKATQGNRLDDSRTDDHIAALTDNGLISGLYHFANPNDGLADAKAELAHFLERRAAIRARHPSAQWLCDALDFEDRNSNLKGEALRDWGLEFVQGYQAAIGETPWFYSGIGYEGIMGKSADFGDCPLWLAQYPGTGKCPPAPARMMTGWDKWTAWQWTGKGHVSGYGGNVDLNVFNGTADELRALAGLPPKETP